MSKVYIVSAKRTAVGSFLGSLSTVKPKEFGGEVVKSILEETKIPKEAIDEVIVGNILPAGQGQGVARQVSLYAGIPVEVPAYGINMVCGSGMKTIMNGYTSIKAGLHHLVIVGGVESMSQAPYMMPSTVRNGIKMGGFQAEDHMIKDALWDAFNDYHMGMTAEKIVEICFDKDEYPKRRTNLEKLASLRPVFKKGGSVTAGNSSGINDGASFMLIASEEAVKKYQLTPLVEIVGIGQGGVDPSIMGLGPVPAIKNVLNQTNLTLQDMDLLELNEAFAAQSLGVITELTKEHNITKEEILAKTNVNGGAIAIGHPVGASGNRITTTLIHEMIKQQSRYGLASLCIGGGMGTAIIVKRVEE